MKFNELTDAEKYVIEIKEQSNPFTGIYNDFMKKGFFTA